MRQRPVLSYDVVIQTPVAEGIKQHVHFAHTDRRCLISKGKLRGVKVFARETIFYENVLSTKCRTSKNDMEEKNSINTSSLILQGLNCIKNNDIDQGIFSSYLALLILISSILCLFLFSFFPSFF